MAGLGLLLAGTTGCISQDEYDKVVADRDALRGQVAKIADELDEERGRTKELQQTLAKSKTTEPSRPPDAQIAAAFAELKLGKGDTIHAVMHTTMGDIHCELYPSVAPTTVLNFVGLAEGTKEWTDPMSGKKTTQPLYDGTKINRVVNGFIIQGGDPLGNRRGGPGYVFGDEIWPDVRFDRPGVLAMMNAGTVDTNGSQFFITLGKPVQLNGKYTIFGLCDLETAAAIAKVPVEAMPGEEEKDKPISDIVVTKMEIIRRLASAGASGAPIAPLVTPTGTAP